MSTQFPPTVTLVSLVAPQEDTPHHHLGQQAATQALQELGLATTQEPLLRGLAGEPLWPSGVVGSIAHTQTAAVAAVAWVRDHAYVGIDLERADRQFDLRTAHRICTPREQDWLDQEADIRKSLLQIFCAKEAIFKAFYPIHQRFFGFQQAEVYIEPAGITGQLLFAAHADFPAGYTFPIVSRLWDQYLVTAVIGNA